MSALHSSLISGGKASKFWLYATVFSCSFSYFELMKGTVLGASEPRVPHPPQSRGKPQDRTVRPSIRPIKQVAQSGLAAANPSFLASVLIYWICQECLVDCEMESRHFIYYHFNAGWDFQVSSFWYKPASIGVRSSFVSRALQHHLGVQMVWGLGITDVFISILRICLLSTSSPLRWRKHSSRNLTWVSWGAMWSFWFRLNCLRNPSKFLLLFLYEPGKDI